MSTYAIRKDEAALNQLLAVWGNRLPSWDEFRAAAQEGRVRVAKNFWLPSQVYPQRYRGDLYLFTLINPSLAVLIFLASLAYALFWGASWWWVAIGGVAAIYLLSVATNGLAQTMLLAARDDRLFFDCTICRGVFYFAPPARSEE